MLPTRLLRAQHAHKPMIHFLGKRRHNDAPHAPAPHPAAPAEVRENFQSFLSKLQSASGGPDSPSSNPKGQSLESSGRGEVRPSGGASPGVKSGGGGADGGKSADYERFWEAPRSLWETKAFSEAEIEAVMSGGATNITSGP